MEQNTGPDGKDPQLWAMAKRRVGFKREFVTYLVINAFLWLLWLLTSGTKYSGGIPWPVWPTLGWGIAVAIRYFETYRYPKENAVEREYDKLKRNQ